MMTEKKRDLIAVSVIGMAVGILGQPVLTGAGGSLGAQERIFIFLGFSVLAPFALFTASSLSRFIPVLYQFAKFGAVGALNTFLDLGVLSAAMILSGVASGPLYPVFKGISFLIGTTNSFFWNKYWTFGSSERPTVSQAAKFYSVAGIGWVINVSSASFVVNVLSRPENITPNQWGIIGGLAGVALSFLWNFIGYKFLVFKR